MTVSRKPKAPKMSREQEARASIRRLKDSLKGFHGGEAYRNHIDAIKRWEAVLPVSEREYLR